MPDTCPVCSRPASGRFCSHCGAGLDEPSACSACGNTGVPAGARFCNQCGAPYGAAAAADPAYGAAEPGAGAHLPWVITGVALVALIGVLLWPRISGEEEPPLPAPVAGAPAGDPRAVDLSSMTPREAADRLFNRVMQSVSSGDTLEARRFLPMALAAYQRVPDLDPDGHYHLAVLQLVNQDPRAARAQADSILAVEPSHLFGLFTAAQAEQALGDEAAARELFRRFLEVYDAEMERGLKEYGEHRAVLPAMREEAGRVAASSGGE